MGGDIASYDATRLARVKEDLAGAAAVPAADIAVSVVAGTARMQNTSCFSEATSFHPWGFKPPSRKCLRVRLFQTVCFRLRLVDVASPSGSDIMRVSQAASCWR
jgi:hypothetical protein